MILALNFTTCRALRRRRNSHNTRKLLGGLFGSAAMKCCRHLRYSQNTWAYISQHAAWWIGKQGFLLRCAFIKCFPITASSSSCYLEAETTDHWTRHGERNNTKRRLATTATCTRRVSIMDIGTTHRTAAHRVNAIITTRAALHSGRICEHCLVTWKPPARH